MSEIRRAVVVGINKYKNETMNLQGAVHDAEDIRNILSKYGPFTIDDKHFLTDERATMEAVREAISDLFWDTEECELALFYFSGHGWRDHYNYVYLLPHDGNNKVPFVKGIPIQELKELFLRAEPKNKKGIMILDCCYSGDATRGAPVDSEHAQSLHQQLSDIEGSGTGRFIISSAGADKVAREVKKGHAFGEGYEVGQGEHWHGAFTFHLIEGLCSGAKDELGRVNLDLVKRHFANFTTPDEQKPRFYMGDASAESVFLTKVSQKLNDLRNEVETLIRERELWSLFSAIFKLNELNSKLGIREGEMFRLLQEIQQIMDESRASLLDWWFNNNIDLYLVRNCRRFKILERVCTHFEANNVRELEHRDRGFVLQVLRHIEQGGSAKKVEDWINASDEENRTLGAGGLAPPARPQLLPNFR
jgi:hypothetical protein